MSNVFTATDPFADDYDLDPLSNNEQTNTPATPPRRSPRRHQGSSNVSVLGTSSGQQGDVFDYTSVLRTHKTYQSLDEDRQDQIKKFCQVSITSDQVLRVWVTALVHRAGDRRDHNRAGDRRDERVRSWKLLGAGERGGE
ncbi:hypothetical protein L198_06296 [Cryptococcus wingfieldii CBS 7118]|uniref:Uncharacterized protein n=1 Tax=Cryptococcus wingfieldii CBS 7118 TaxID=1295528 RepID=A0A1E3ILY4_9TREE|nr:hypothetical protein L198_06296 [Cryptococcus wingfieldii CBS 7118]ODN89609.1 hypothetical protein L198_06296 [Cryptococcus wingfieldii CBS 7118]